MSIEIKTQPTKNAEITKTSVSASIDNSIQASATIGTGNKNASIDVGASVKTGTVANASAGLDGKNVYVNVGYSDTTEAHLTSNSNLNYHGVGNSSSVDAYAVSGTQLEASMVVGKKGVDVSAGASSGTYVGVDASTTVNLRGASGTVSGGVTVGDHLEIGGGGKATYDNGKVTMGVSGEVALLVGAEVDLEVSVDTKQIQKDANTAIHTIDNEANKIIHSNEVKTATHTVEQGAKEVSKTVNKAGKDVKKAFKKIKL
jgi:hypothetical protein